MEDKRRILIAEDDAHINELLHTALSKAGYSTVQVYSGSEAKMLLGMGENKFDLILLDLMLPGMTGEELLAFVRFGSDVPVIVLTAKDELDDKVSVLTGGADDYITKPFEIPEVVANYLELASLFRWDIAVNGVTEFREFLFQTFENKRFKVKGSICGIFQKFIQYGLSRFAEGVRDNVSQLDIGNRETVL